MSSFQKNKKCGMNVCLTPGSVHVAWLRNTSETDKNGTVSDKSWYMFHLFIWYHGKSIYKSWKILSHPYHLNIIEYHF